MKKAISVIIALTMIITLPISAQAAKVGTVSGVSVTAKGSSYAKLKWKSVKNASGYQIYRSMQKNKGFKLTKSIKGGKTVTAKITKMKSVKTYYFKIRAIKGKAKGKFSKTITVKTLNEKNINNLKKRYYYRPNANSNGGWISVLLTYDHVDADGYLYRVYYDDTHYEDDFVQNDMKNPKYTVGLRITVKAKLRPYKVISGKKVYGKWKTIYNTKDFDLSKNKNIKTISESNWEKLSKGYQYYMIAD